jgi:tetratricopeptide (TPR) repeat protein/spermidine synthase
MGKRNKKQPAKVQQVKLPELSEVASQTPRSKPNLQTLLFAFTIFVSASLLFVVEPMFAKMILPRFGGAPAVWNTCLVFYQAVLLGGYLYAHLTMKWLGPRWQAVVHLAVLLVPWVVLPIHVTASCTPPADAFPVPWVWLLLTLSVGLPFFVVSASAPVLQAWFAQTRGHSAKDPYFLYAASNLGSLLALLSYPLLIEANLTLTVQSWAWSVGFGLLVLLFFACAIRLWRSPQASIAVTPAENVPLEVNQDSEDAKSPTFPRRLRWLLLSAIPSSLLLGVTTHLTVDIVSMPLLWVVPLALYLLTFVIVFARRPILAHRWMVWLQPYVLVAAVASLIWNASLPSAVMLLGALHLLAFFLTAMVCHGELAADRPPVKRLTEFYLWMSLGGVLGGLFNALVAPVVFSSVLEYPLMIAAACMVRPRLATKREGAPYRDLILPGVLLAVAAVIWVIRSSEILAGWRYIDMPLVKITAMGLAACAAFMLRRRPVPFGMAVAALSALSLWCAEPATRLLHAKRSFFGVLRVEYDPRTNTNIFVHGLTHHGQQRLDGEHRREPLAYFHKQGPLGHIFRALEPRRPLKEIGILGLGAGTIAAYGQPGERMTFYEIDPVVERIAWQPEYFTYLSDCKAKVEVVMGDARLSLVNGPERKFDLLILDVFNSDSVPLHLVTREAFAVYLQHLTEHGVLAAHISSRYLHLEPSLSRLAVDAGLTARICNDVDIANVTDKSASEWVVMTRHIEDLGALSADPRWVALQSGTGQLWTDDFSNIVDSIQLDESWSWIRPSSWLRSTTAQDYAALGTNLAREGKMNEAIEQFEKALEIDPLFAEVHDNLGAALASLERFDEAFAHYKKALDINPHSTKAMNNFAAALIRIGQTNEALDKYLESLKIDPRCAETYGSIGAALASLQRYEEACRYYNQALTLQPDWAQTQNNLAIALSRLGKNDEAIPHWQRALELDPRLAEAHQNLGITLYLQQKAPEAIARWRKGLKECPGHAMLHYLLARILATSWDPAVRNGPEAVELAKRALQISGGQDPKFLDVLAAAYAEAGRFPEAVETVKLAIAAANNPTMTASLQAKLKLYQADTAYHEEKK